MPTRSSEEQRPSLHKLKHERILGTQPSQTLIHASATNVVENSSAILHYLR
jgi:hypothetical protein